MKFSGMIGFVRSEEVNTGVWKHIPEEKHYKGDVLRKIVKWQPAEKATDDININNQISIVANPYVYEHLHEIRYIVWHNVAWKVVSIEDKRPRVILEIGGVYNGKRPA